MWLKDKCFLISVANKMIKINIDRMFVKIYYKHSVEFLKGLSFEEVS